MAWSPLDANDVTASEGYYGIQARNLLAGGPLLSPALEPHGPPGFKPPLYPALLALSIDRLGPTPTALRWPSIVGAALTALAAAAVAARAAGPVAGVVAALLFLTLPWVADLSRLAASMIALTALGAGAIALVAGGAPPTARAALAGLLLGLAFQTKLWMAALPALPAVAALWPARGGRRWPLVVMIAVATGVGALHLAGVAAFEPENLSRWLEFYFKRHLLDRIAASGFEYAEKTLPPGWYWAIVADAWVLALPLIALGTQRALARLADPAPRAALAWALGTVVLSAFTLKLGNYLYAVMPAFAVLAAIGAAELAAGRARVTPLVIAFALAGAPWVVRPLGDAPPVWAWAGSWLAFAVAMALVARRGWGRAAAIGLVVLASAGGLVREWQRLTPRYHDPGYRAVAAAIAPRLEGAAPQDTAYRAPDAPAFGYYLMRPGSYWWLAGDLTPAERAARLIGDPRMRVFVIDPTQRLYGGWPGDSLALRLLEGTTREITAEIEAGAGRTIGARVFVRDQGPSR